MSRKRRNNTKRREANQRLPLSYSEQYLRSSRQMTRNEFMTALRGGPLEASIKTRWEPSNRLQSHFKKKHTTQVDMPNVNPSTQKSKKYSQPNWSDVTQKKIEQPASQTRSICEDRRIRREVMFAKNQAGKTGQKTPLWTEQSRKKCK